MKDNWHINHYQREAVKTAVYPHSHSIIYPALGLAGEAGEIANKVKKFVRDGYDQENFEMKKLELMAEIGDVMWYCAALARDIGFDLQHVAQYNIHKLQDRAARGKIQGDGDDR